MKEINEYLTAKIERTTAQSQWADIVGRFTDQYNIGAAENLKISYSRMAVRLSILKKVNGIGWLEWFYEDCKKRDNFGRYFNFQLKTPTAHDKDNT